MKIKNIKTFRAQASSAAKTFFLGLKTNLSLVFNVVYATFTMIVLYCTRTEEFIYNNSYLILFFLVLALIQQHSWEIWLKKLIMINALILLKFLVCFEMVMLVEIDWGYYFCNFNTPNPALISLFNYFVAYVGLMEYKNLIMLVLPGLNFLCLKPDIALCMMQNMKKMSNALEVIENSPLVQKRLKIPVVHEEPAFFLKRSGFFPLCGKSIEELAANPIFNKNIQGYTNIRQQFDYAWCFQNKFPKYLPEILCDIPLTKLELVALCSLFANVSFDERTFAYKCIEVVPCLEKLSLESRKQLPQLIQLAAIKYFGWESKDFRAIPEHLMLYYGDKELVLQVNKIQQVEKAYMLSSKTLYALEKSGVLSYEGYRNYLRSPFDCAYVDANGKKTVVEVKVRNFTKNNGIINKNAEILSRTVDKIKDQNVQELLFLESTFLFEPSYEEKLNLALEKLKPKKDMAWRIQVVLNKD